MTFAIPQLVTAFMLAFARVGTLVMLLPGTGEQMIPARLRLSFALLVTLTLFPMVRTLLPPAPTPAGLTALLIGEILVGFVLGLATRMMVAALQVAGTIVAQELGLSFAMTVDPTYGGQDASITTFLTLLGVTLVFATDLHHVAIAAIRDSYTLLPPVGVPQTGDVARLAIGAVARGFALGVQISAPFVAFGVLFNLGLGILSRLMPQMQVFFLAMPLTILVGCLVFLAALGLMMNLYLARLGQFLSGFGAG